MDKAEGTSSPMPHKDNKPLLETDANGVSYTVRYRLTNRQSVDSVWKYVRTTDTQARLNLAEVKNGDELQVQVQAERGGQVIEDWSQPLLISVTKRSVIGGVSVDDDDLLPPLDFTANILSPSSVRLEWTPNKESIEGLYYVVNMKQLTSETGGTLLRQQIKIEANNFALGNLTPGERYEMTIRTATSPERISSTAAIVEITMPREDEYFEVGNLVISSHFKSSGHGIVNLTWEVPPHIQRKIKSYDVQYSEAGSGIWHRLQFSGQRPMAVLTNLKSDTEYLLKIRTILQNDLATESGQFKFKTPEVVANPISKVDVIYSNEANMVRLQWILEPHVPAYMVVGYDVYLSEDKDLPDSEWRHIHIDNKEGSLSLPDLKSATTYYVRVNVRKVDGTIIRAPSIYRFRTMGSTVLYTDRKDLGMEHWARVDITDPQQHSVVLSNLRPGTRYYVHIIPQIDNERFDSNAIEMFEIRTDEDDALC
ncbi:unnamed protein product [Toxocara canis]|uniref:Protein-tyrosine-phosphatase n=1 Tax=Toxocara canis TaxID=6265 RepID=A0A183UH52_TOXCA|nr:unnamed protein product [Toxocara canis]